MVRTATLYRLGSGLGLALVLVCAYCSAIADMNQYILLLESAVWSVTTKRRTLCATVRSVSPTDLRPSRRSLQIVPLKSDGAPLLPFDRRLYGLARSAAALYSRCSRILLQRLHSTVECRVAMTHKGLHEYSLTHSLRIDFVTTVKFGNSRALTKESYGRKRRDAGSYTRAALTSGNHDTS